MSSVVRRALQSLESEIIDQKLAIETINESEMEKRKEEAKKAWDRRKKVNHDGT
jgi:Arc/MetJ-type ribon-helix-helix transcriptional regulator